MRPMRCLFMFLALAATCLAAAGTPIATTAEDATITARIESSYLFNGHLNPMNIKVHTSKGVVTLSGGVRTDAHKALAERIATSTYGVKSVHNQLTVVPKPTLVPPHRTFTQKVEDKTTTASVRARLLYHKELAGLKTSVRTEKGVVTLSGVVGSEDDKQRIGTITAETRGVERVVNNLTVRPGLPPGKESTLATEISDEWTEKRVEAEILLNGHVSILDLNADVDHGLCILTGTVRSEEQRALVENIALHTRGVDRVRNDIRVREPGVTPLEPIEALEPLESK